MPATVHHLPIRPRQTLADLCEPSREQDEALLRVIAAYEAEGGQVLFSGEGPETAEEKGPDALASAPQPYVSEYLTRPLRTEQQAREDRAKLPPVFADIFDAFGMTVRS